ncbi:MAG TPA: DNA-processing protein DprA [Candidatus Binatia bacterium]
MQEEQPVTFTGASDILPWLALKRVQGLGCVSFKRIVDHLGDDATRIFGASEQELAEIPGLERQQIEQVRRFSQWDEARLEMRRLESAGVGIIPYNDGRYPARLRMIPDPPPLLYLKGELGSGANRAIAVVGSRSASEYGLSVTRRLSHGLASLGFLVVSGMARGIDGEAHRSALAAGAPTAAVLGSGVDVFYPPEHEGLYHQIAKRGAVLSELPLGTPPLPHHFPSRNRLISGLSLGVVVVEATEKSGSLITAGLALEQGREVFAVPGPAGSSRSRGTHQLIRQGAKLVESVEHVVEELAPQLMGAYDGMEKPLSPSLPADAAPETRKVFALVQQSPLQIDEVIQATGLSPAKVSQILLDLEIKGFLRQLPGKRFMINETE